MKPRELAFRAGLLLVLNATAFMIIWLIERKLPQLLTPGLVEWNLETSMLVWLTLNLFFVLLAIWIELTCGDTHRIGSALVFGLLSLTCLLFLVFDEPLELQPPSVKLPANFFEAPNSTIVCSWTSRKDITGDVCARWESTGSYEPFGFFIEDNLYLRSLPFGISNCMRIEFLICYEYTITKTVDIQSCDSLF